MAETAADIVYRALRSANADPDLAHAVSEAMRDMVGQNVVTEIRADMAELRGELAELRSELKAVHHAIASANRIKTDPAMPPRPGLPMNPILELPPYLHHFGNSKAWTTNY